MNVMVMWHCILSVAKVCVRMRVCFFLGCAPPSRSSQPFCLCVDTAHHDVNHMTSDTSGARRHLGELHEQLSIINKMLPLFICILVF